jgi:hypothetical protein
MGDGSESESSSEEEDDEDESEEEEEADNTAIKSSPPTKKEEDRFDDGGEEEDAEIAPDDKSEPEAEEELTSGPKLDPDSLNPVGHRDVNGKVDERQSSAVNDSEVGSRMVDTSASLTDAHATELALMDVDPPRTFSGTPAVNTAPGPVMDQESGQEVADGVREEERRLSSGPDAESSESNDFPEKVEEQLQVHNSIPAHSGVEESQGQDPSDAPMEVDVAQQSQP